MEGAAQRRKHETDLAIFTAWHTAVFVLNGYSGKLKGKSLSDYLSDKPERPNTFGQAISFFHGMKAKGVPIDITRTPREVN